MGMREKIARFFYGRYITYGFDRLSYVLFVVCLVISLLNLFIGSILLQFLETALFVYAVIRLFSKNIYARQKENRKAVEITDRFLNFFKLYKRKFDERKTHVYKTCPNCKANLRLPRRKGQHTVKCPKCKTDFSVNIR